MSKITEDPLTSQAPLPGCACGHRWEEHGTYAFGQYCLYCGCEKFTVTLKTLRANWRDAHQALALDSDALLERP